MRSSGVGARLRPRTALFWGGLLILSASPLALLTQLSPRAPGAEETRDASGMTVADIGGTHAVIVTSVQTGGPAERGGVRAGDRLSGIGGRHPADRTIAQYWLNAPGACRMRINFLRGGKPIVATLDRCRHDRAKNGTQDTGGRG